MKKRSATLIFARRGFGTPSQDLMVTRARRTWWIRLIAALLVPVQLMTLPPALWAAAATTVERTESDDSTELATIPKVEKRPVQKPERPVKRTLPPLDLGGAPSVPLSSAPTAEEITKSGGFIEPLVPILGEPTLADNQKMAVFLGGWKTRGAVEDFSQLDNFVRENPQSPWVPALLLNKGLECRRLGYFSLALSAWQDAWNRGKSETTQPGKALMDRAAGELAELNARLGRYEWLEPFFAEISQRDIQGSATEKIAGAKQGLWLMRNKPEDAFRCGPMALDRIRAHEDPKQAFDGKIRESKSTLQGLSLTAVGKLASDLGMNYVVARRDRGASFEDMLPAVIHWKVGHYAALLEGDHGRYRVDDPTFGGLMSMSQAAVDAESSGYFLVPKPANDRWPHGWHPVTAKEGAKIWGKGNTGQNDPRRLACRDIKVRSGSGCKLCPKGMADYDVFAMLVSLQIADSPVGYVPPRGPEMLFTVRYNQRDSTQPAIFTYSNFGPKWSCDWFAYVEYDDTNPLVPPAVALLGGGSEIYPALAVLPPVPPSEVGIADATYAFDNSYYPAIPYVETARYQANRESRAVLQKVHRTKFVKTYPDGSQEIYDHLATPSNLLAPRRLFLTKQIDALGQEVTLTYDNNHRLCAITDVMGQVSTLHYDLASDPLKITSVEDPFGRTAYFEYNGSGRLVKITDVLELTSEFTYGAGDFIDSLTTGYGTTNFVMGESGTTRWIEVTDPQGRKERTEFRHGAPGIPTVEPVEKVPVGIPVFNNYLGSRNSFYWNKAAYKQAFANGGQDYTKARLYHWLHTEDINVCSGILESTKEPYESRIWRHYQGQVAPYAVDSSMHFVPDKIARVMDDGSTQLYQYEYNQRSQLKKSIDPLGRETQIEYEPNDLDVQEVRQKRTGGGTDLVASFTHNANHQPLTQTDAAGQTVHLAYDNLGRLESVEDVAGHETTFVYNDDGYLESITGAEPGDSVEMEYDGYGRVNAAISNGYTVQTEYDALDRPTRVSYPDGSYEEVTYNLLNPEWTRDRAGRWTRSYYNAIRQLIGVLDPAYQYTAYDWCGCGALKKITDPLGRPTIWNHDAQGRVTSKVYPDKSSEIYEYEPQAGRLAKVTDALGQQTTYQYYPDNSVASVAQTSPIGRPAVNLSYVYETDYPRLASLTDNQGVTQFTYVPVGTFGAGRVASIDGALSNDTIAFTYDQFGRTVGEAINGTGSTVHYDSLGRIDSATNVLGTFGYQYVGASGRFSNISLPNGQSTTFGYTGNTDGWRLNEIQNAAPGGGLLSKNNYQYRGAGGPIANWTRQRGNQASTVLKLAYDSADRLTDATLRDVATQAQLKHYAFRFDAADNRTGEQIDNLAATEGANELNQLRTRTGGGKLKVRGALNEAATVKVNGVPAIVDDGNRFEGEVQVTTGSNEFEVVATDGNGNVNTQRYQLEVPAAEPRSQQYDAVGNLISETRGIVTWTYEWDASDRLMAINAGTHRTEFAYNGLSQRVRITEKESNVVTSDRRFVWSGMTLSEERDATGANVNRRHLAQGEQRLAGADVGSYYYARDHLGNVCEVMDATGAVRARYEYAPYGSRLKTGGDLETDRGYTGHYLHGPTGLYLTPTRLYSPETARWLSRDPIGERGGLNLYTYVRNDPINATDPLGLVSSLQGASAGDIAFMFGGGALFTVATGLVSQRIENRRNGCADASIDWGRIGEEVIIDAAITAATLGVSKLYRMHKLARLGKGETSLLEGHLKNAVKRYESEGLTAAQERALIDNPNLKAAFRGDRIDSFFKESVRLDPKLSHLEVTPRFQSGPDVFNPMTQKWWDVTTPAQWEAHVEKYWLFGDGVPLLH